MQISDNLLCLFNATIETSEDGLYHVTIPQREIEQGSLDPEAIYRIGVIASADDVVEHPPPGITGPQEPQPPVEVGEVRYVDIEDIGKQGDGIARVERGYVIIVPGAEMGDQVKIEISDVKSNFAVGEIIDEEIV